jgi:hypothetical protein
MRTVRQLITEDKSVYIYLRNRAIAYRFLSDAEREGIPFGTKPATMAKPAKVFSLRPDGTTWYLTGFVSHMRYGHASDAVRIDYEKYVDGEAYYMHVPKRGE